MPIEVARIKKTGAIVINKSCETCGGDAPFGVGADVRGALSRALQLRAANADDGSWKRRLGKWYCREHRPA